MKPKRKRLSGMTLIEMVAAVTVLMIMVVILAQVFYQASTAAAKGKAMGEIYQVARALESAMAKDFSGATLNFFAGGENGRYFPLPIGGMPPGPYDSHLQGAPFGDDQMWRMLMGGSDYMAFVSMNAGGHDRSIAKVFYCLRASGEFVRVAYGDTGFAQMDYLLGAIEQGIDYHNDSDVGTYEEQRVMAENVERVKFSFLDRFTGPISEKGPRYGYGYWVDDWDWTTRPYLPAAVKVELQIVDHAWRMSDDDRMTNAHFDPTEPTDGLRASEQFDPDDGEPFVFIVDLPLGTR